MRPYWHATLMTLKHRLKCWSREFSRFTHRSSSLLHGISEALGGFAFAGAVVCIICFIIYTGYEHSTADITSLLKILRWVQGVFIFRVIFDLIFNFDRSVRHAGPIKWIVDAAILLTLLPWIFPRPASPWIGWLDALLYSRLFLFIAMASYSAVTLCFGIIRAIGKRTNPSLLLSCSFAVVIIIGTFLLMLPKATYGGIDYMDALFVSTSAVCITGLTPVDIYATFTPLGITILAVLIQIGGLGVMTFTSFFALFFSGNATIYSQLLLRDMIYSRSMNALMPTLLYILGFTIVVELAGAAMILVSIHGELGMTFNQELAFSTFHSLSAFCNAGFSNYPDGMANPLLLYGNMSIYWIMTLLIVAGSIGFPILVNFRDAISDSVRRLIRRMHHREREPRNVHPYNMNTKLVLSVFTILFVGGAVAFWLLEHNNSLAGETLQWQVTQAAFNSATPRSAGFMSVNPSGFLSSTLVIVMFLMWVGGASQSTGGGVKVNTLGAILLNIKATVTGRERVTAFKRTVATQSLRRANAMVTISVLSYLIFAVTLLILEPELPVKALLFEALSAVFTVGSSLGVTPYLSHASEGLLCAAMFLGRVGLLSLLTGFAGRHHEANVKFPADNIIIN